MSKSLQTGLTSLKAHNSKPSFRSYCFYERLSSESNRFGVKLVQSAGGIFDIADYRSGLDTKSYQYEAAGQQKNPN